MMDNNRKWHIILYTGLCSFKTIIKNNCDFQVFLIKVIHTQDLLYSPQEVQKGQGNDGDGRRVGNKTRSSIVMCWAQVGLKAQGQARLARAQVHLNHRPRSLLRVWVGLRLGSGPSHGPSTNKTSPSLTPKHMYM